MERWKISYAPRFAEGSVEDDLQELLVSGVLVDEDLARRIDRLAERFRIYARYYPHGMWAPGAAINGEMRNLTETYLPMGEICRAFDRLFSLALKFPPLRAASILHGSVGWLDFLQALHPIVHHADPSALLRSLMADERLRRSFIFANFIPSRYGGGFGRYPQQHSFLAGWLAANRARLAGGVRSLDAACGTGEGTYELARLLMCSGFPADVIRVRGTTLEPLEMFAAAHAHFPHDPKREALFRHHIKRLLDCAAIEKISFHLERIGEEGGAEEACDIILCNGFLGGPFLHALDKISAAVESLAGRLAPGGVILAADRFHGGWKKLVDEEMMRKVLTACGLRILPVAEGVGGEKERRSAISGQRSRHLKPDQHAAP